MRILRSFLTVLLVFVFIHSAVLAWPNGFGVNIGARAQSQVFIDRDNLLTFDGYGVLNVGARYRRGGIEYALNVNNLTDTEYFASVLYDTQLYPGEPINVLGTVRIRFR